MFLYLDSLPLRIQFFNGRPCGDDDDCQRNEMCKQNWCICSPGNVKTTLKPLGLCEPGLSNSILYNLTT